MLMLDDYGMVTVGCLFSSRFRKMVLPVAQRRGVINFQERIIFGSLAGKKVRRKWGLPIYNFA